MLSKDGTRGDGEEFGLDEALCGAEKAVSRGVIGPELGRVSWEMWVWSDEHGGSEE